MQQIKSLRQNQFNDTIKNFIASERMSRLGNRIGGGVMVAFFMTGIVTAPICLGGSAAVASLIKYGAPLLPQTGKALIGMTTAMTVALDQAIENDRATNLEYLAKKYYDQYPNSSVQEAFNAALKVVNDTNVSHLKSWIDEIKAENPNLSFREFSNKLYNKYAEHLANSRSEDSSDSCDCF